MMRFNLLTALIAAYFLLQGCGEPTEVIESGKSSVGLTGRWKQTTSFFSIGDANVQRRELPDSVYQYVQFNADSTIETNIGQLSGVKKFRVLDEASLQFSGDKPSPTSNKYSLKGNTLDLYFQCIEVCGGSFERE